VARVPFFGQPLAIGVMKLLEFFYTVPVVLIRIFFNTRKLVTLKAIDWHFFHDF
jgi:hypothetical protein